MIRLNHLDIGYKKKGLGIPVFKNLEISLEQGELVGLMGNNGIGKSTLLKTITGTLPPLSGEVLLNQKNSLSYSAQQLAREISIVVTEKIGGFNLTAWDVVASGRIPYLTVFGKLGEEDECVVNHSLEQLSIVHLKETLIDELSDGQRQKVMIAKSLAQQTPVIILDEPTAFLDYNSKHQLFKTLRTLCVEQNKLILVSSHDLDLMKAYVHKSILLEEGDRVEVTDYA